MISRKKNIPIVGYGHTFISSAKLSKESMSSTSSFLIKTLSLSICFKYFASSGFLHEAIILQHDEFDASCLTNSNPKPLEQPVTTTERKYIVKINIFFFEINSEL